MSAAIRQARLIVAALVAGPLVFWVIAHFLRIGSGADFLVMPAVLFGLVSPVIAYRVYLKIRERSPSDPEGARAAFIRANILALAITEGAALLGCIAYLISYHPLTYVTFLMHVILAGAIWPNEYRLQQFLEGES